MRRYTVSSPLDIALHYNEEAVLKMALGLALNLRSVYMFHQPIGGSINVQQKFTSRRQPWQGFLVGEESLP